MTRVLIVDDHPTLRQVLRLLIEAMPGMVVVGDAESAEHALALLDIIDADLVLIDVSLPRMSGFELCAELARRRPNIHLLVCSGHSEVGYVEKAFAVGADGYVLKGDPLAFQQALEAVVRGERHVSGGMEQNTPRMPIA